MTTNFSYCHVSTTEQTTENQIVAIRQKGYDINNARSISETVSGSVEAMDSVAKFSLDADVPIFRRN